jgi:hypothetical protein
MRDFVWKLPRGGFAGSKIICKNWINEGESIKLDYVMKM